MVLSIEVREATPHGSDGEVQQKVPQHILHKSYTMSISSCYKTHKTQFHSSDFNKTTPQTNKLQLRPNKTNQYTSGTATTAVSSHSVIF